MIHKAVTWSVSTNFLAKVVLTQKPFYPIYGVHVALCRNRLRIFQPRNCQAVKLPAGIYFLTSLKKCCFVQKPEFKTLLILLLTARLIILIV